MRTIEIETGSEVFVELVTRAPRGGLIGCALLVLSRPGGSSLFS
jgi:hypothetical protein